MAPSFMDFTSTNPCYGAKRVLSDACSGLASYIKHISSPWFPLTNARDSTLLTIHLYKFRPRFIMYPHSSQGHHSASMHNLITENGFLREQVKVLHERVSILQAENAMLRTNTAPNRPAQGQVYAAPTDNALALPAVIESLAVMRNHFHRQGTLKQW